MVKGPDVTIFKHVPVRSHPHPGRGGETAPEEAKKLLQEAQRLADGPVLGALKEASDDLYAWAATRVANQPSISLHQLLGEMTQYGLGDLAEEASKILELHIDEKAGSTRRCRVGDTQWIGSGPGRAQVELDGETWALYDFKEEIMMTEELAGLLGVVQPEVEKRQCVTKVLAAGCLMAASGDLPSLQEVELKAQQLRLEQARLAADAEGIMGHPEPKVTVVEHELRMYAHDILRAHHDKDYRAAAVFPLEELDQLRLGTMRIDYKGDVILEYIPGGNWREGQPTIWTLIWRGHMTLLVPPSAKAAHAFEKNQEAVVTPSLGFHYFWHQRHDQPRTVPGVPSCRHCKPLKKAGAGDVDTLVRKDSCLSALAMFVAGGSGSQSRVPASKTSVGPSGLKLQEFFAGHAVITKGWNAAGEQAGEPVELFSDPHHRRGRRDHHDLSQDKVQQHYLTALEKDEFNVEWIACPCTTFCDWNLQNRGTRTFDNPMGQPNDKEALGNTLSIFGAMLFERALQRGHFPVAESSGLSGRYPKQWHLPAWQRLLRRPDVDFLEIDMCAYGLCPLDAQDDTEFYRHRTGLAFPRNPGFRLALLRLCPGLSARHRHVPLQGARPGTDVTRCTEAGVYAPAFVRAVVEALLTYVGGGEKAVPRTLKAGGQVATKGEGEGDEDGATSSGVDEEEEEDGAVPSGEEESGQSWHPEQGSTHDPEVGSYLARYFPGVAGAWYTAQGGDPEGEPEEPEGDPDRNSAAGGEGREDGESEAAHLRDEEDDFDPLVELAVDCPGGDSYLLEESRGMLWIFSQVPRRRLIVPGGQGCPWRREEFSGVRFSRCVPVDGTEIDAWEVVDDFRVQGNQFMWGPNRFWTGTTVLMLAGHDPPPDFPWACDTDDEPGGDGRPGAHEDEGDWSEPGDEGAGRRVGGSPPSWSESPSPKKPRTGGAQENGRTVPVQTWKGFREEHLSAEVEEAAFNYVQVIGNIQDKEADTWREVCQAGDRLLSGAGSVENAAKALWIAREQMGMNNLDGVNEERLDELLPGDLLSYLRDVRARGMPARFQGERTRVRTQPHPRARANMNQVYEQLMKDVAKHRVLVVNSAHEALQHTISSPFEAVPKMLPNRTLSKEVRLVHDQRMVNQGTDKTLHPPAVQPMHRQIVRRILWLKTRFPGVDVLLAKKDVAGAFRLLWVDPRDVELFGGDVGWKPEEMGSLRQGKREGDPAGMTMLYLVSSFGFSGSPGEWNVWGRATEELHKQHHPACTRRDGKVNFDGKILVDDMVLVEPVLGLRPWISSEVYEDGVIQLLGQKAVNAVKDAEEGQFASAQLVWGVRIDAKTEKMSLPEARVAKGAHLLQGLEFSYGEHCLTLKDLQRFRGIATGWATIVKGLKNELKAADRFLGGVDGASIVRPKGVGNDAKTSKFTNLVNLLIGKNLRKFLAFFLDISKCGEK